MGERRWEKGEGEVCEDREEFGQRRAEASSGEAGN